MLQPVAHALLQCAEEVRAVVGGMSDEAVRARPAGVASCAYHVRHAAGSLDRLLTYARGAALDESQLESLAAESRDEGPVDGAALARLFAVQVARALDQLRATDAATLLEPRAVGRGRLPSTVVGLLVHAAEHTQRHVGQLATTARVVSGAA